MAVDFKSLDKNTQGALASGAAVLVLSFFPYYIKWGPFHDDAWVSYATLAVLLGIAATALIAIKAFKLADLPDTVPWSLIAFGGAVVSTVLLVLRALTVSPGGPGWSGILLWVASAALSYFAFALFKASGEKMPDFGSKDTPSGS